MLNDDSQTSRDASAEDEHDDDGDLTDMLGELRVLLPTAQLLSAFLVTVPFAPGFADIVQAEKKVFLVTFMLSLASLVFLSAPAVQHRLMRPLKYRAKFKTRATGFMLTGACSLGIALVFSTQLVLSQVLGNAVANAAAIIIAALIVLIWLVIPLVWKPRQ